MSMIETALNVFAADPTALTAAQAGALVAAGICEVVEGNLVLKVKSEKAGSSPRGSKKAELEALQAEWQPQVDAAIIELAAGMKKITFDSVWKLLGCPEKAQHRQPILNAITAHVVSGNLEKVRPRESNFGIFYLVTNEGHATFFPAPEPEAEVEPEAEAEMTEAEAPSEE
jgi:hypothetical protein